MVLVAVVGGEDKGGEGKRKEDERVDVRVGWWRGLLEELVNDDGDESGDGDDRVHSITIHTLKVELNGVEATVIHSAR
jgi:hypothetical protein